MEGSNDGLRRSNQSKGAGMNKPSGSFLAWENTLCNALDHPRIQSQNAWEDGYASGVAAEREACAKVCENLAKDRGMFHPDDEDFKNGVLAGAGMCAVTIRMRGQK